MTGWCTVPLGDVASISRHGVDPTTLEPETRYIGLEHISTGGGTAATATLGEFGLASTKFAFTDRHVLFGKLRPNLGKVSRPGCSGVCSTDILPILPGARLDAGYLAWFLRRPETTAWAAGRAAGANLPRLSPTELVKLPVPLPPLEEQRRIAAILDQADALRTKRREALNDVETLTQSIFAGTFGSGATSRFPKVALGRVARVSGGKRLPKGSEYAPCPTDHPYIRVMDMKRGSIDETTLAYLTPGVHTKIARYTVMPGDVVISIAGSIGLVAAVPDTLAGANLTENAARVRALDASTWDPVFMASVLRTNNLQSQIAGRTGRVTIGKLALFRIEQLEVPLPPLSLQQAFRDRISSVQVLKTAHETQIAGLGALFASLRDRAFKGEL